jgi:hypothetical protein
VWPGDRYARVLGEVAQAAGGGVPVHPGAAAVEQDRAAGAVGGGAVDGPADRRGQRDQDDLGSLAAYTQDAVAVFLAQVGDVGAGGFEDPQAQQPEHGHQREVVIVDRLSRGGQQRLELQVSEPEGGRLGGTFGRRTCSAGECSSTASMTQVR